MSVKTQSIGALFVALVVILAISPKVVNNIYSSILGRLFLVCVVIFFAMNNTTLGLLAALAIITASNQFGSFVEGMENEQATTIGYDNTNTDTTQGQTVLTNGAVKARISEIKQSISNGTETNNGIDLENIKNSIRSRDSKEIPVDPNMNSSPTGEVSASSEGMLNSKIEGFSSWAPF